MSNRVREERSSAFEKLIPVSGNIFIERLDLSLKDRKMLIEKVSIIFHEATIVKFNSTLKTIISYNIRVTKDICNLVKKMKNLTIIITNV
jgi:fatty acyl-CoA reductase